MARYLQDGSQHGQILVLIINELGDFQMRAYFNGTDSDGGMMCQTEKAMVEVVQEIHRTSFQEINETYIEQDNNGKICAIPLPHTAFFEVVLMLALAHTSIVNLKSR